MVVKTISLCEGHKGGFVLMKIIAPKAVYRRTPITKLKVVVVGKERCVQCKANAKARRQRQGTAK